MPIKTIMPALMQSFKPAIVQNRPQVERDYDAIVPLMLESMNARLNELNEQIAAVYARNFTADELRERTQATWDRFYALDLVWRRSRFLKSLKARLAFVLISKLYRQMYANTGIATDSARVRRSARWARWLARLAHRLFASDPMPALREPRRQPGISGKRIPIVTVP